MNCYICNEPLIWGGDESLEQEDEEYEHKLRTNLSCNNCDSLVFVYHGKQTEN